MAILLCPCRGGGGHRNYRPHSIPFSGNQTECVFQAASVSLHQLITPSVTQTMHAEPTRQSSYSLHLCGICALSAAFLQPQSCTLTTPVLPVPQLSPTPVQFAARTVLVWGLACMAASQEISFQYHDSRNQGRQGSSEPLSHEHHDPYLAIREADLYLGA